MPAKPTIKLLAVLEPFGSFDTLDEVANELHWMPAVLESDWVNDALICDGSRGFIHVLPNDENSIENTWVMIYEPVSTG